MVMDMKSNLMNMEINKDDLINKPTRDSARRLHRLYDNSAPFEIPTAKELMLKRIQLDKWFYNEFKDLDEYDGTPSDETLEYCELLGVNYEDVEPLDY